MFGASSHEEADLILKKIGMYTETMYLAIVCKVSVVSASRSYFEMKYLKNLEQVVVQRAWLRSAILYREKFSGIIPVVTIFAIL